MSREQELEQALRQVCIGGNSLASALIGHIGAENVGLDKEPPNPAQDYEGYEMFICWREIMKASRLLNEVPA